MKLITILFVFVCSILFSGSSVVIADEVDYISYDEYKADYYLDYSPYDYYMSSDFVMPYRTVVVKNRESLVYQTLINAWQVGTFNLSDITEISNRKIGFYEAFLFDVLYTGYEPTSITGIMEQSVGSLQASTFKKLSKLLYDDGLGYMKKNLKDMSLDEMEKFWTGLESCSELQEVFKAIKNISDVLEYATTVEDLIYKLCKVEVVSRLTNEYVQILNRVASNTSDQSLKKACIEFAGMCSGTLSKDMVIGYMVANTSVTKIASEVLEDTWENLIEKLTGYGVLVTVGQELGKWASGLLFSTDKEIETFYEMSALYDFENEMRKVVKSYEKQYLNSKTQKNAKLLNASFEILMKTLELGCDISVEYAGITYDSGAVNLFLSYVTGNHDKFLEYKKSLNNIASDIRFIRTFANSGLYNAYLDVYKEVASAAGLQAVATPDNTNTVEPILLELKKDILKTSDVFITSDVTLTEDFETFGDVYIQSGTLWLNGHNFKVAGNIYLESGTIRCSDGTLEVGNNIQTKGGMLYLDGGTVTIGGDVIFATIDKYGEYNSATTILKMDNEEDRMTIKGDFITCLNQDDRIKCSAGTIYLHGNWENHGKYYASINTSGTFELILASEKDQKLFVSGSQKMNVATMIVEYADKRSVIVEGKLIVGTLSENVKIKAISFPYLEFDIINGALDIEGDCTLKVKTKTEGNITVTGNLIGEGIRVSGKQLKVTGNYQQLEGVLYLDGGTVEVEGNVMFAGVDKYDKYTTSQGILKMDNAKDCMIIKGDFITCLNQDDRIKCSAGTLYLHGNWENHGTYYASINTSGTFELILASEKDQKLFVLGSQKMNVATMIIEYADKRSIIVEGKLIVGTLSENVKIKAISSPYLEFDIINGTLDIEGDCTLKVKTKMGGNVTVTGNVIGEGIRLSGKELKITGNYQQLEGVLYVNGGTVVIEGDVMFASIDKYGEYKSCAGILKMDNEKDCVVIQGDLTTYFSSAGKMQCSAGELQLHGNWYNYGSYIYNSNIFEVLLASEKDQTINNQSSAAMKIPTLILWNGNSRNVHLLGTIEIGEKKVLEGSVGKEVYSITYELDGGAVVGNPATYSTDTATFVLAHPVKEGYTFFGWTGSNGTIPQKMVTIEQGSQGNLTFIANWKPENYRVSYDLIQGDINTEMPIVVVPGTAYFKEFNQEWFDLDLLQ